MKIIKENKPDFIFFLLAILSIFLAMAWKPFFYLSLGLGCLIVLGIFVVAIWILLTDWPTYTPKRITRRSKLRYVFSPEERDELELSEKELDQEVGEWLSK